MYKLALAVRYLLKRRIAYISIVAITFGVMTMIVVMSVMDGFQHGIKESVRALNASLEIRVAGQPPPNHFQVVTSLLEREGFLAEQGGPIEALSPRQYVWALVAARNDLNGSGPAPQTPVQVIGTNAALERRVLPWDELLTSQYLGSQFFRVPRSHFDEPLVYRDERTGLEAAEKGIILGIEVAHYLGVGRGDLVTITTVRNPKSFTPGQNPDHVTERFRVTGCFATGRYDYDKNFVFVDSAKIQKILGTAEDCDWVLARLDDPEVADEVKKAIEDSSVGGVLVVNTWRERVRILARALDIEKGVMLIIMFFTVLVAGACICGILYMLVLEKTRDIGILMSMGATTSGITGVFLAYGGVLGFTGTALGVFLGLEVVWNIAPITGWLDESLGFRVFPPEVYKFDDIPVKVNYGEIAVLATGTMAWSLLASLLPAWRASRLDPVKCLGYE